MLKTDLKSFQMIWRKYYNLLPVNFYEFDIYAKLVNKIKTNDFDLVRDKLVFQELLNYMTVAIHNYKDLSEEEYDETKVYDDEELMCCQRLKSYLK